MAEKKNVRDARTGQYVKPGEAKRRPGSTVSEPRGKGGKRK